MDSNQKQLLPGPVNMVKSEIQEIALSEIHQINRDAEFAQNLTHSLMIIGTEKDEQGSVNLQQTVNRIEQPTACNKEGDEWILVSNKRNSGPQKTSKSALTATSQMQQGLCAVHMMKALYKRWLLGGGDFWRSDTRRVVTINAPVSI